MNRRRLLTLLGGGLAAAVGAVALPRVAEPRTAVSALLLQPDESGRLPDVLVMPDGLRVVKRQLLHWAESDWVIYRTYDAGSELEAKVDLDVWLDSDELTGGLAAGDSLEVFDPRRQVSWIKRGTESRISGTYVATPD